MIVTLGAFVFGSTVTGWRAIARDAANPARRPSQTKTRASLSYYVTIIGGGYVTVKDEFGHSNTPILTNAKDNQIGDFIAPRVPDVSVDVVGENAVQLVMPTDQTYTIGFRSGHRLVNIELIKGEDNRTPERAVRYADLSLPADVSVMLKVRGNTIEQLRYDKDGTGTYDATVPPTIDVSGPAARDITPPVVSFAERLIHGRRRITISATDRVSGVKAIYYSLDNKKYERYTQPLVLEMKSAEVVYAFADDRVANRSSIVSYTPKKR
jgi:hypothetical protein